MAKSAHRYLGAYRATVHGRAPLIDSTGALRLNSRRISHVVEASELASPR